MAEKKKSAGSKNSASKVKKAEKKAPTKKVATKKTSSPPSEKSSLKKTAAKKMEEKNSPVTKSKARRTKKKTNLMRLCSEMNKVTLDAVDKEVTKRFRILIDAAEEDITKTSLQSLLKNWKEADLGQFHESLQPYVKHFVFMVKRRSGR